MSRLTTAALFLSLTTLLFRFAPARVSAHFVSVPQSIQSAAPHYGDRDHSQNQAPDSPVNDADDATDADGNDAHSHGSVVHFLPTLEVFDESSAMSIPPDHSLKPLLPPPDAAALL